MPAERLPDRRRTAGRAGSRSGCQRADNNTRGGCDAGRHLDRGVAGAVADASIHRSRHQRDDRDRTSTTGRLRRRALFAVIPAVAAIGAGHSSASAAARGCSRVEDRRAETARATRRDPATARLPAQGRASPTAFHRFRRHGLGHRCAIRGLAISDDSRWVAVGLNGGQNDPRRQALRPQIRQPRAGVVAMESWRVQWCGLLAGRQSARGCQRRRGARDRLEHRRKARTLLEGTGLRKPGRGGWLLAERQVVCRGAESVADRKGSARRPGLARLGRKGTQLRDLNGGSVPIRQLELRAGQQDTRCSSLAGFRSSVGQAVAAGRCLGRGIARTSTASTPRAWKSGRARCSRKGMGARGRPAPT